MTSFSEIFEVCDLEESSSEQEKKEKINRIKKDTVKRFENLFFKKTVILFANIRKA